MKNKKNLEKKKKKKNLSEHNKTEDAQVVTEKTDSLEDLNDDTLFDLPNRGYTHKEIGNPDLESDTSTVTESVREQLSISNISAGLSEINRSVSEEIQIPNSKEETKKSSLHKDNSNDELKKSTKQNTQDATKATKPLMYQYTVDEITISEGINLGKQIYSPKSTYTGDDFKNFLCWISRNLKMVPTPSVDSIPCAIFFSKCENAEDITQGQVEGQQTSTKKVILYLHKFTEDLGMVMPTVNALHKKLNMNIIAMEFSGYGVSFDNYEEKSVSIANDMHLLLKFITYYLNVPLENIYIICFGYLASCVIEVTNWFEKSIRKKKKKREAFGGIIIIKPKCLEMRNRNKAIQNKFVPDNTQSQQQSETKEKETISIEKTENKESNTVNQINTNETTINETEHKKREESINGNNEAEEEKRENAEEKKIGYDIIKEEEVTKNLTKLFHCEEEVPKEEEKRKSQKSKEEKNVGLNKTKSTEIKKEETEQEKNKEIQEEKPKKIKRNIFSKGFHFFKKKGEKNKQKNASAQEPSEYEGYEDILTFDISLFYDHNDSSDRNISTGNTTTGIRNSKNSNNSLSYNLEKIEKMYNIPFLLFKRILKDTFDINHVKNSIEEIYCPLLILHSENCSFEKSCSKILFDNAKKSIKKAAVIYDFMNEDFVKVFNYFFSENAKTEDDTEFFNSKLLSFYVHSECDNNEKEIYDTDETNSDRYSISDDMANNESKDQKKNDKYNSTISMHQDFFISPKVVNDSH